MNELKAAADQPHQHMGATSGPDLKTALKARPHGQHNVPLSGSSISRGWKQDSFDFLTSFADKDRERMGILPRRREAINRNIITEIWN